MLIGHRYIDGNVSVYNISPFWVVYFLIIHFGEFFIHSGYKSFIRYILSKYVFPVFGLAFHSLNSVF